MLTQINSTDRLVEAIYESMKLRRVILILRSTEFYGDLETILNALDQKKADYQLYSLDDLTEKENKHQMLYGVKEAMEFGQQVIMNLDFRLTNKPREFLMSHVTLTDCLSTKFINRDSQEILREFMLAGVPEPMYMHHEFLMTLAGAQRVDFSQNYKPKLQRAYKFIKDISRLQILVVDTLAKQTPFYQTEFIEESVNFDNVAGKPDRLLSKDGIQE